MYLKTILIVSITGCEVCFAQAPAPMSVEEIVNQSNERRAQAIETLKQGIVRVEAQKDVKDTGTGIVLSSSPERILILTALHVVKDAKSVDVVFYADRSTHVRARKLPRHSDALDLAILEITPSANIRFPHDIPPYRFVVSNTLQPGAEISTANGEWIPVRNGVTRLNHEGDAQKFEYTNVSVGEGFSGGPVFDQYGNVVGMHDALDGGGNFAVAIKIDSALQTLEALDYNVPKPGQGFLSTLGQQGQAAAAKPMRISRLTVNGTFQPTEGISGQMIVTVTPNAGGSSYTATLMGGVVMATFTNGTANENEQTFTFKTLQPGMVPLGDKYLNVTGGSLSLVINQTLSSAGVMASGNLSGSVNLVGTALTREQLAVKRRGYGRAAPTDNTPVTLSGQLIGTYSAMLVPKDSMAATVQAAFPGVAAVSSAPAPTKPLQDGGSPSGADHHSGAGSSADPCRGGCKAAIGSFKMVRRYQYPHPKYGTLKCDEKVFEFAADWPGGPYLHSVVCNGPNARGAPVTLINFRLAESDRVKDQDVTILFDNATGVGSFSTDRQHWRVKIYGTGSVESMLIEIMPL